MPVTVFVGTSVDGFRRAPRVSECGGKFRKTLDGLLRCIRGTPEASDHRSTRRERLFSEQLARSPAPRRVYGKSE